MRGYSMGLKNAHKNVSIFIIKQKKGEKYAHS